MRRARALLLSLAFAAIASPAAAQVVGAEASLHSVRYRGVDVEELTVPVGVTWQLGDLRFDANTAWARASMSRTDGTPLAEMSGLTDITARLMYALFGDRARVILAANIPTGQASLSADQDVIATALGTQLFGFPIATFGSGAGVTTGVAYAQPVAGWVVGFSGAYRLGDSYEPLIPAEGGPGLEFRPGQEMRVRVALDRPVRDRWAFRVAGSWSTFGWDQQNGEDFFRAGNRVLLDAMMEMPFRNGSAIVYGWHMQRAAGLVQDTLGAVLNSASGRSFTGLGGRIRMPLTRAILLRPGAEVFYQNTEEGVGVTVADGFLLRAGMGVAFRLGSGVVFEPAARYQIGRLDGETVQGLVLRGGLAWAR